MRDARGTGLPAGTAFVGIVKSSDISMVKDGDIAAFFYVSCLNVREFGQN